MGENKFRKVEAEKVETGKGSEVQVLVALSACTLKQPAQPECGLGAEEPVSRQGGLPAKILQRLLIICREGPTPSRGSKPFMTSPFIPSQLISAQLRPSPASASLTFCLWSGS